MLKWVYFLGKHNMPRKKIKIVKAQLGYCSIGHSVYSEGAEAYNSENPNYIWGYGKGKVSKWAETPECRGHANVPHWTAGDWFYYGRYDARLKKISCVICDLRDHSFRNLPKTLISQLEQFFPNAREMVVFE